MCSRSHRQEVDTHSNLTSRNFVLRYARLALYSFSVREKSLSRACRRMLARRMRVLASQLRAVRHAYPRGTAIASKAQSPRPATIWRRRPSRNWPVARKGEIPRQTMLRGGRRSSRDRPPTLARNDNFRACSRVIPSANRQRVPNRTPPAAGQPSRGISPSAISYLSDRVTQSSPESE